MGTEEAAILESDYSNGLPRIDSFHGADVHAPETVPKSLLNTSSTSFTADMYDSCSSWREGQPTGEPDVSHSQQPARSQVGR